MKSRRSTSRSAYTLVEVLVAMGILALAIGAASSLSLSQSMTEDINQRESFAVNYAENAARLWQLGIDDTSPFLLQTKNADGSLMTLTLDSNLSTSAIDAPAASNTGDDGPGPTYAVTIQRTNVRVAYKPQKYTTPSDAARAQINTYINLDYPVLRQIPPRR